MRSDNVAPQRIHPNPWNTNIVSHENEVKIQASLQRHGFFRPVLVRETDDLPEGDYQSVGGWHRVEQAIELGFEEVPIVNLGRISDDKAKEISLLDNAQYGHQDVLRLAEIVSELGDVELTAVMPWSEQDVAAFSSSLAVDVDSLDLDDAPLQPDEVDEVEQAPTKEAKTHEILRFKCSLTDAARVRAIVSATMKTQGFTAADDLTNAGDALVHLIGKELDNVAAD